ncbi:MAG: lysoplasmalogenase family protein, partial [Caulobacterales bacterium]
MALSAISWAVLVLGAAAALLYGFRYLNHPPSWMRALIKTAAVASLAFATGFEQRPNPLALALVLSALGDFFLAFDKKWSLPLGLFSFLLAQLLYFLMFFGLWIAADH